MTPIRWEQLGSIVCVRTDHIGDLICSTPFLRHLRLAAPQARITAVVPRNAVGVLEGGALVDEMLVWEDTPPSQVTADLVIALSPRTRTYRWAASTGAPLRAGYYYPERLLVRLMSRWWLTHPVAVEVRSRHPIPHEVEQQAVFARALGLRGSAAVLDCACPPDPRAQGRVVLHLAPGWFTHGWLLEDFVALCQLVKERWLIGVTFGPGERAWGEKLRSHLEDPVWGDLPLREWGGLLSGALAVVSVDTGAVHLAAAGGRPVVVVYQSEHFQLCSQQWYPWNVPHRNLSKSEPERTRQEVVQALEELQVSGRR